MGANGSSGNLGVGLGTRLFSNPLITGVKLGNAPNLDQALTEKLSTAEQKLAGVLDNSVTADLTPLNQPEPDQKDVIAQRQQVVDGLAELGIDIEKSNNLNTINNNINNAIVANQDLLLPNISSLLSSDPVDLGMLKAPAPAKEPTPAPTESLTEQDKKDIAFLKEFVGDNQDRLNIIQYGMALFNMMSTFPLLTGGLGLGGLGMGLPSVASPPTNTLPDLSTLGLSTIDTSGDGGSFKPLSLLNAHLFGEHLNNL